LQQVAEERCVHRNHQSSIRPAPKDLMIAERHDKLAKAASSGHTPVALSVNGGAAKPL
jgi:hypothetical protein